MLARRVLQSFRGYSRASGELSAWLESELQRIKASITRMDGGTYKHERIIIGRQSTEISVLSGKTKLLNFCANNYLGLSSHPEVIQAAKEALDTHGAGMSSVRFICGTQDIHRELEIKIAKFHGREDSILYAACFDANGGFFDVLTNENDAIISDELNHASIIDGIRLCKAKKYRYKHIDMADLERILAETKSLFSYYSF
ncbi:unnamed protein product [Toxocara canis]|uniref:Aminotran_1_2 domain-containing protein n=1 Tax=Toxocara canis TaxID=6265 RepID=A0A183U219_TOXCA|nr:unnamed protein product [Toxocara canis]